LIADGPVVWGKPIPSRAAGVFVVEAADALEQAPFDHRQIRGWLERVPATRLDGAPTTPHALAARLATIWVPGQHILYVGRSMRSIGARVAAMYATPLGDSKPHAGGHLLKTLSILRALRIWWAETEAHEEYEDELLNKFAAKTGSALPFANESLPAGGRRTYGLSNELREPTPQRSAATQQADMRALDQKEKRAAARSRKLRVSTRAPGASRPAPEPTYVSREGHDELVAELDDLRGNVRPGVIARVKAARELGDLKENADYEYARKEQSFVEGRIQTLEAMLKAAVILDDTAPTEAVGIGSTVTVDVDGDEETYVVVGPFEADPARGRISSTSPVGKALYGRRAGEDVTAAAPGGSVVYRIKEIR
jgi:transcription elongation factor GreA